MIINFKIMTASQAWQMIRDYHYMFHTDLKQFNPHYAQFIPQWTFLDDMFNTATPTHEQIEQWHDKFMQHYDAAHLHACDKVLEFEARPALERVVKTLTPFAKKWNVKIPKELTIWVTYGVGGSYDEEKNEIILRGTRVLPARIAKTLQHELVHIIIEQDIIQRFNVPQDLKERIVDIICQEYFGKDPQKLYLNSFANKYINRTVIESDLPAAVKKMMSDFTALNQKIADSKSNG